MRRRRRALSEGIPSIVYSIALVNTRRCFHRDHNVCRKPIPSDISFLIFNITPADAKTYLPSLCPSSRIFYFALGESRREIRDMTVADARVGEIADRSL